MNQDQIIQNQREHILELMQEVRRLKAELGMTKWLLEQREKALEERREAA